jgi:exopolyphosphatase/guanosine-5'-triphosphate,3'-diphosphate pyrophosphatase
MDSARGRRCHATSPGQLLSKQMNFAALDLGSNSFHLLVAHMGSSGAITKLASHKEVLKLGRVVQREGRLPEPAYATALEAVGKLTAIARAFRVERIIVAGTSALRDAANGREFCDDVQQRFGVEVELLSGTEEGRVVYRGARSAYPGLSGRVGVVDIGGGSVEVCLGEGSSCDYVASLPLGFLRLSAKLDFSRPGVERELSELVSLESRELSERLRWKRPDTWIFSGGTARAIGKRVLSGPNGASAAAVKRVATEIAFLSPECLRALGIDAQRVDMLGAGARVLIALIECFEVKAMQVSPCGLREGLLLREFARTCPELRSSPEACSSQLAG